MPPNPAREPDAAPSRERRASDASGLVRGVEPGVPLSPAGVRELQRTAGNTAARRLIARSPGGKRRKPSSGRRPPSARRNPPRYSVALEQQRKNRDITFFDPADRTYKRAWTPLEGYARNPSTVTLKSMIGGLVGSDFENGTFPYVVDVSGDIVIGKWLMPAAPERYWPTPDPTLREYSLADLVAIKRGSNIPTETLIGGTNPEFLAAGRLHISKGKIDWFDNVRDRFAPPRHSPPRESLDVAEQAFRRLPASLFAENVKVRSYLYYLTGEAYTRTIRTIKTYEVRSGQFTTKTWIEPPEIAGGPRGPLRAGTGAAAAISNPPRYGVPLEKQRASYDTVFFDRAFEHDYKRAWTPVEGYANHPRGGYLDLLVGRDGLVGPDFRNGTFQYVVDVNGDILVGQRWIPDPPSPRPYFSNPLEDFVDRIKQFVTPKRGSNVPTQMLIGGKDPEFLAAGRLHVTGGKIDWFDNVQDPDAPPRESVPRGTLDVAEEAFKRLPADIFARRVKVKDYRAYVFREPYTRTIRTIKTYEVKGPGTTTRTWIKPPEIAGSMRGRLRAGTGTAAVAAGGVVVDLALQYLASKVKEKFDNAIIERELKRLAPDDIKNLAPEVKALLAEDRQQLKALRTAAPEAPIYLNVLFEIAFVQTEHYNQYEFPPAPATLESPPVVKVHQAGYSREPSNPAPSHSTQTSWGNSVFTTIVPYSVMLSPEEVLALENLPVKPPEGAGDTEIREWLKGHSTADITKLADWEKARLIHRLLDGWVSDDDLRAIESVCRSVTDKAEMERIDHAIRPRVRRLWSARQRDWLSRILDIRP
jgi:hypothetical protein